MMHQKHPPPSIRQTRPDAPQDLVSICLRMMAKKPSGRYQSASEAGDVLADWLTAHGHAVDSGSGSSSGRLAAAAAGMGELVRAKRIGSPQPVRPGSGKGEPGSGVRPAGTAKLLPSAGAGETMSQRDHPTTAGSGSSPRRAFTSGQSDPKLGKLPVAQPIDQQTAAPQLNIQADSSVVDRIKRRRPMSKEEQEAHGLRRRGIPVWVWGVIAAGGFLALVLLILLLL